MNTKIVFGLLVATCAATNSLIAQAQAAGRSDHVASLSYVHAPTTPGRQVWNVRMLSGTKLFEVTKVDPSPLLATEECSVLLPGSSLAGSITAIESVPDSFLVSAVDPSSGNASLFQVAVDNQSTPWSASIVDQHVLAQPIDPISITYNTVDGRIYLYDQAGFKLRWAAWVPGTPLSGLTFATISVPVLETMPSWGVNAIPYSDGVRVLSMEGTPWDIRQIAGVWSASPHTAPNMPYRVQQDNGLNTRQTISMTGPVGGFELVNVESDTVVLSGVVIDSSVWTSVPLPTGTVIAGQQYYIRGVGTQASLRSTPFYGVNRWGEPLVAGTLTIAPVVVTAHRSLVGDSRFGFATNVEFAAIQGQTVSVSVLLWIAAQAGGAPPPVIALDPALTHYALVVQTILGPDALTLSDEFNQDILGVEVPIPNIPSLAGTELYGQFVAANPTDGSIAASDVAQVVIQAVPSGALSSSALQGAQASSGPNFGRAMTAQEQAEARRMREQMARQLRSQ